MDWERLTGTHSVSPVSEVSPYTHRDAVTHLEEIKNLSRWSHGEIDRLESLMRNGDLSLNAAIAAFKKEMDERLERLDSKFMELFADTHEEHISFDPTNGTRIEGISTVVSRMYDNLRVFALFASDFDRMGWTAKQWDIWMNRNSARHFDLGATFPNFNDVEGLKNGVK